ncbi:MAG: hypothetical protein ACI4F1_09545 [Bariatricus sp.]
MQKIKLQWHSAFSSGLRIELGEDMENLLLEGDPIPMQLLVVKELTAENNFWMKSLRNDYKEKEELIELLKRYEDKKDSIYYQAVMDIIMRANSEAIKEAKDVMCDALKELCEEWFADEFERKRDEGLAEGRIVERLELIAKKLRKNKSPEEIAEDLEEELPSIVSICSIMREFAPEYDTALVYQRLKKC